MTYFCVNHVQRPADFYIANPVDGYEIFAGLCSSCAVKLAGKGLRIDELESKILAGDRQSQFDSIIKILDESL